MASPQRYSSRMDAALQRQPPTFLLKNHIWNNFVVVLEAMAAALKIFDGQPVWALFLPSQMWVR